VLPAGTQGVGGGGPQAQQAQGVDFCPQRLPAAQARIEELYARVQGTSRRDEVRAEVRDPMGNVISVSVASDADGAVVLDSVETGLSDVVLDCGDGFSDKECFVEVFVDGERMLELGPTAEGRVPMRCLPAGDRLIRIDSVATTLFEGVLRLESDHEYLVTIAPEVEGGAPTLLVTTVNRLIDRVPPVPTRENTTVAGGDTSAGVAVAAGGATAAATLSTGDATAPSVSAESSATRSERFDERERSRTSRRRGSDVYERDTRSATRETTTSRVSVGGGATGAGVDTNVEVDHHHGDVHDRPRAMSPDRFARLREQVDDEMGSEAELRVVRAAAAHNLFTSAQVAQLVGVATMGSTKVEVAVTLYPSVVDPENFHEVLDAMTFESNKREVVERLGL
jgi:hypothetical protein